MRQILWLRYTYNFELTLIHVLMYVLNKTVVIIWGNFLSKFQMYNTKHLETSLSL